jgi:WD40 repeat protein
MFSSIRTLLLVTAIAGVMVLPSSVAHAITITRAEVQWGDAVVMGRGAADEATIYWEDEFFTANKRGKFSFRGAVPSNCEGILRTVDADQEPIVVEVELDNCTPDSGGPVDPPGDIPELVLAAAAHQSDAVRAVGFIDAGVEGTWIVVSGGEDKFLRRWSWTSDDPVLNPKPSQKLDHTIYDLEVSADGSIVVTGEGGWNGGPGSHTLRILDADGIDADGSVADIIKGTTAPIGFVYCVAISPDPDNLWIVASGFYGEIVVYGPDPLELNATKKTKKKRTKALAFSPDGATLASTSTAGRIQLWSFDCDSQPCELGLLPVSMSHGGSWAFPIAFAPYSDSNWTEIVSGSDGGTIKVWTIDDLTGTPAVVSVLPVASGAVYSLDWWSPDNPEDSMIVAGGDGDITVYDASMGILFQTVNAHTGRVNDVAFSPDGTMIVSGGADGVLKLWYLAQ